MTLLMMTRNMSSKCDRQTFLFYIQMKHYRAHLKQHMLLTLKVQVTTIDTQWEGMGDVGSARYEPALLPPRPTIRVLSYSN